jgi:peptide-methionine (S)-S-oxide reductase
MNINALFQNAVDAIDSGDIATLENLISTHPDLVRNRWQGYGEGYFKAPYLLWFVPDNPIRTEKLAGNIAGITSLLIQAVKRESPETAQNQLDYALGLVVSGSIVRKARVQIALMDLLIDAGAAIGDAVDALANGNIEAAQHLLDRGARLTLTAAICLDRTDDIDRLATVAGSDEKMKALTAAAFYGKADQVKRLLALGAEPNGYPDPASGFHAHATPLHQAVSSGSIETVKLLVEAGADLNARDKEYEGTPVGWADYLQRDGYYDDEGKSNLAQIEAYLRKSARE